MVAMGGAEDEELERLRREKLEKMLREAGREGGGKLREKYRRGELSRRLF